MSYKGKEVMVTEEDTTPSSQSVPEAAGGSSKAALEAEPAAPKKMVVLRSNDGEEYAVESSLLMGTAPIKNMINDGCADIVLLPNVTGVMLRKVVEYWRRHAQGGEGSKEMKEWDANFAKMDEDDVARFELISVAHYLEVKPLLDLLCRAVADTIKDFTVEQVRKYFDIENDFTPEEEAVIKKQNKWAFNE